MKQTDDTGGGRPPPGPAGFRIGDCHVAAGPAAPGLHVVATPIGNLGDISLRALRTLAGVDAVLAEDTRTSKVLLAHYGIDRPLVPYHEHNAGATRPGILARLGRGEALALISDAGTPLISDPGYKLVEAAVGAGYPVTTAPGASAVMAALVLSGLPTDRFFFEGFLPARAGPRRSRLAELKRIPATLVLFESPHRVVETLADAAQILGPRPAAVERELTKRFETVRRGSLADLARQFAAEQPPRGEIVIVLGAPADAEAASGTEVEAQLRAALATMSVKDAAAMVAGRTGEPRRKIYAQALALAAGGSDDP